MIKIYYKNTSEEYVEVSTGNNLSSPINTTHDGRTGTVQTLLLYLRNDDEDKYYTNISILPVDLELTSSLSDVLYEETGWGIKLSTGGVEPSSSEWENVNWGESITIEDIGSSSAGDTTTYYPFWYMISSPPNTDAQIKKDLVLRTNYTENAVI